MNGKTILTTMFLMLSLMTTNAAGTQSGLTTLSGIGAPPYKYMERGIKTRLEDLKPAVKEKAQRQTSKAGKEQQGGSYYAAIKTNIAYYAGAVANLGVEAQLHPQFTLDMPVALSFWDMERDHGLRLVLFQPEARWWPAGAGTGHFIGVHAHVAGFNVQWNDYRYQSAGRPLYGAGISYGYSLRISDDWNFEFNIGAGYANLKYDRFYNVDNGAKTGSGIYDYWGITRLGLSLVYKF